MKKGIQILLSAILVASAFSCGKAKTKENVISAEVVKENKKPNIIYILADDLGYGDLSSFGQQKFNTPHIDKLAAEGMLFTQHYAGNTVCAPSRSALLTGMHTGHTPVRGNKEVMPEGQYPIPDNTYTMAEALQKGGGMLQVLLVNGGV
ncbi:choline-sulfatase [Algibacter lectus]|uniref:Choline-sulfatase n=1 Tax=Algibacter lectus TaxID=221126 RepID=A0A090WTL6_9FLAO|nr:sulfatase-like hydrolase/transferase [Algibacter lectus]GAL80356.1 choline-sulfatase [Algibacter lectus]